MTNKHTPIKGIRTQYVHDILILTYISLF